MNKGWIKNMFDIELEHKTKDDFGIWRGGVNASLNFDLDVKNGLELFIESSLEKWHRLNKEDTIKLFQEMGLENKNDDEKITVFLNIFTKEEIAKKGSEKIFLELCEKYDVKPEYGAYFID